DADRERIDARRHREKEHDAKSEQVVLAPRRRGLRAPGFPEHLRADAPEQNEGDPVVPGLDQRSDAGADQPADDRHQSLEAAEEERDRATGRGRTRVTAIPRAAETAVASIARPTERARMAPNFITSGAPVPESGPSTRSRHDRAQTPRIPFAV